MNIVLPPVFWYIDDKYCWANQNQKTGGFFMKTSINRKRIVSCVLVAATATVTFACGIVQPEAEKDRKIVL